MKNLRGLSIAISLGLATTAMAQGTDPYGTMLISENYNTITVNGSVLEDSKVIEDNGTKMIPLRAICEALGFEVTWNNEARRIELIKLPAYITLTPDSDGYTFAKTAPIQLGKAPILKDDRTYVPINFIDEILQGSYDEEGGLNILWGVDSTGLESTVYVKEVTEEGFLVEDFYRGDIRIAISDETVIVDSEGNAVKKEDVDTSKELIIEYSEAMTMSLPPLANATKITVTNEIAKPVISGEITEIVTENDKIVQIVLGDNENALNVNEELIVTDLEGNPVELKKGMNIKALTNGMATRSIPPQPPTISILVTDDVKKAEGTTVYVKEVTEEGFLVEDFYRGEIRLGLSEETVIVDSEGDAIKKEDVDTSKELVVEYSEAMTMSLPPLANAIKITVTNENAKPVISGEITEIIKENDKIVQLILGDNENALNISEDIIVTDIEGNAKDIEFTTGMTVKALTKGMATMSIPAQYPVSAIIVVE